VPSIQVEHEFAAGTGSQVVENLKAMGNVDEGQQQNHCHYSMMTRRGEAEPWVYDNSEVRLNDDDSQQLEWHRQIKQTNTRDRRKK